MESAAKKGNPLFSNNYKTSDFIWAASLGEGKLPFKHSYINQAPLFQKKETVKYGQMLLFSGMIFLFTFDNLGAFGNVKLAWLKENTDNKFAIKAMKKKEIIDSKHVDHIENEKKILEQLEHPFIVSKDHKHRVCSLF